MSPSACTTLCTWRAAPPCWPRSCCTPRARTACSGAAAPAASTHTCQHYQTRVNIIGHVSTLHVSALTRTPRGSSCRRPQSCWAASPGRTPDTRPGLTSPAAWPCTDNTSCQHVVPCVNTCQHVAQHVTLLMASIQPCFSARVAAYTAKLLVLVLTTQPWSTCSVDT